MDAGNDFGNFQNATKSGMKFNDLNANGVKDAGEPGLGGWTITATATGGSAVTASTTTNSTGHYELSLAPGSYNVTETLKAGWTQSFPAAGIYAITLTSGEVDAGNDFGNFQNATKSGYKYEDMDGDGDISEDTGNPLAGWEIHLDGTDGAGTTVNMTATTNASGYYEFSVAPGSYNVSEVLQAGWTQSFPAAGIYEITLTSGEVEIGNDFGNFQNANVTVCKEDFDGNRLNGWTINLFDASGVEIAEGVTSGDGCVTFTLPQLGNYSLTEDLQPCWTKLEPTSGSFAFTATSGYHETFTFVNTPIIITVTVDNTESVCEGESVQLLLLDISGGTPDYTYSWVGPGGFTSILQNPTVSPAVAGTYTLTVTDAEGCWDTATTVITVFPNPDCTITAPSPVVPGSTNTASVQNAGSGATYAWTITGPGTITSVPPYSNSITWTANAAGTVTISVTVTTANGCHSTCSRPVAVRIPPPPCQPEIQLAVLIDGSSTIDASEWATQINGLYNAILDPNCIPDCYVELTVIQFAGDLAGGARTEVGSVVITRDNRNEVAQDVLDTVRSAGTTPMEAGINRAVEVLRSSPYFNSVDKQIINISSDVQEDTLNRAAVETARDNAISAGIDEISAEGVGDFRIPQDQDWLTSEILYPQGNIAPGSWVPGWVYAVGTDAAKFKEAICNKISPPLRLVGDVNNDGSINVLDYVYMAQHLVGTITLTGDDLNAADVDGNDRFDVLDYVYMARYLVGAISEFPRGKYI